MDAGGSWQVVDYPNILIGVEGSQAKIIKSVIWDTTEEV